jgi:hypothetical protein
MPLHVSSNKCSSSGGSTFVNTSSGITHSGGLGGNSWPARHTLTHQSVLYQTMYWPKLVLLIMSTCCSKHVEAWNKYIDKECVKLVINQNYVEMHGQQNIKYTYKVLHMRRSSRILCDTWHDGNLCSQSTFFSTSRSAGYYAGQTVGSCSFLKLYFWKYMPLTDECNQSCLQTFVNYILYHATIF